MLNPALELGPWSRRLTERGRVQVPDVLEPDAARAVQRCLAGEVPWQLALRSGGAARTVSGADYAAASEDERRALVSEAAAEARSGFAFAYESYQMITAYLARRDPGLSLHRITEYLNAAPFLAFARALTGDSRIVRADCQATCYRSGHFLTRHNDSLDAEGRLYAYVLGLTDGWEADWGGLLHFLDEAGNVLETFVPRFNALSVFRVPAFHSVSLVAPWARAPRYSITGWFRSA